MILDVLQIAVRKNNNTHRDISRQVLNLNWFHCMGGGNETVLDFPNLGGGVWKIASIFSD